MSSIVIAGDTSGSVTLQAPAVAGSTVLNLPSTSGTIQTSGAGYTTNGVAYATSTSALSTGSALTFDGSSLAVAGFIRSSNYTPVPTTGAGGEFYYVPAQTTAYLNSYDRAAGTYKTLALSGSTISLQIGGSEAALLNASGNLGLGVTPSAWAVFKALQVGAQGAVMATSNSMQMGNNVFYDGAYKFIGTGYANRYYQVGGAHYWTVSTASGSAGGAITETQQMTLGSDGQLMVGTTAGNSSAGGIHATGPILQGASGLYQQQISINSGKKIQSLVLGVGYSDLLLNELGGNVLMGGTDPSALGIGSQKVNCIGSSGSAGLLATSASGNNASAAIILAASTTGYTANIVDIRTGMASGTGFNAIAYRSDTSTQRFFVRGDGNCYNTNGTYGTISDQKLKENIVDATPKLADVMRLQVKNFNFKTDANQKQIGFIAQEVEQVFPAMVDETADQDADGNLTGESTKSIKTTVLIPILVKAIQEQQALINTLTDRISVLENK